MLQAVLTALGMLRSPFAFSEKTLHENVAHCLAQAGLVYSHEARIGKGCRIDFLVDTIGIEVKKGKIAPGVLVSQLSRYAACEQLSALVVVVQYSVAVPKTIAGKPVVMISVSRNWGVALP